LCQNDTKVLESRPSDNKRTVRRRRQCQNCNFRFSTIEEMEILDLKVIKRNQQTENYSREKIINGLKKSLQKKDYTLENFKKLISDIERDVQIKSSDNAIYSKTIGDIIMKHLKKFDKVAYVRFASVYKDFKDPEDFTKEVKKFKKLPALKPVP